jgi:hypothetical protein
MTLDQSLNYKIINDSQDQWFLISNPTIFNLSLIKIKVLRNNFKVKIENSNYK